MCNSDNKINDNTTSVTPTIALCCRLLSRQGVGVSCVVLWIIYCYCAIIRSKMNYRMSENYEEEILRLNRRVKELLSYSEKGKLYHPHSFPEYNLLPNYKSFKLLLITRNYYMRTVIWRSTVTNITQSTTTFVRSTSRTNSVFRSWRIQGMPFWKLTGGRR